MATGCSSLNQPDNSALVQAGAAAGAKAVQEQGIDIGPLPATCYELIPYPPIVIGEDSQVQNKRWRLIVDKANREHVIACVRKYYENLRAGLKKGVAK